MKQWSKNVIVINLEDSNLQKRRVLHFNLECRSNCQRTGSTYNCSLEAKSYYDRETVDLSLQFSLDLSGGLATPILTLRRSSQMKRGTQTTLRELPLEDDNFGRLIPSPVLLEYNDEDVIHLVGTYGSGVLFFRDPLTDYKDNTSHSLMKKKNLPMDISIDIWDRIPDRHTG